MGWFLLSRLLRRQADQLGKQWADSILEDVLRCVSTVVTDVLTAQLASLDEARRALWAAVRDIEQSSADARDADRPRPRLEPGFLERTVHAATQLATRADETRSAHS